MSTKLVAYLSLDGTTREAMEFYKSVFGGELILQTFADAKMVEEADSEEMKNRVIHAQLTTDEFTIMSSDSNPKHGPAVVMGNSVNLSLIGTDTEKLTEYFNKLSEGGKIEMPLEKQFWGDTFGALEDKFGIHWMVNISAS